MLNFGFWLGIQGRRHDAVGEFARLALAQRFDLEQNRPEMTAFVQAFDGSAVEGCDTAWDEFDKNSNNLPEAAAGFMTPHVLAPIALEAWAMAGRPSMADFLAMRPGETAEHAVLQALQVYFGSMSISEAVNGVAPYLGSETMLPEETMAVLLQNDAILFAAGVGFSEPQLERIAALWTKIQKSGNLRQQSMAARTLYGMGSLALSDLPINDAAAVAIRMLDEGVRDDAKVVLDAAAKAGSPLAWYHLAMLLRDAPEQYAEFIQSLEQAYELGDPRAGWFLACHNAEVRGVAFASEKQSGISVLMEDEEMMIEFAARGGLVEAFPTAARLLVRDGFGAGAMFALVVSFTNFGVFGGSQDEMMDLAKGAQPSLFDKADGTLPLPEMLNFLADHALTAPNVEGMNVFSILWMQVWGNLLKGAA